MTGAAQPSAHTELPTPIRLGGCMPRGRSAAVAARRRLTSVRADPEAGLRWPQLIRIGPEDSTGTREHRHSRRRPALGRGRPRWRSRSRSVCSAAPGRQHAAGPQPCIQRRSRCHQGRGHHWPFRSPFRAQAVIVFTYDWLPVKHRGPGVPAYIPECHGPLWTLQMMTRVDCQATSGIDPPATPKTDPPKKRRMLLKWWVFR